MIESPIKKVICPECLLTPILTLENNVFISKCLNNHKISNESIDHFLSEKINEEDFKCPNHKLKDYFCFCKKCQKNICIDCYEYHEEHENDLILFHKFKPKKREYDENKMQFKEMEYISNISNNLYLQIKNLKEKINELNELINKEYDNLNIFNNKLQNEFLFNKAIFESYNTSKINYNSILNIKNLIFRNDKNSEYLKSINIKKNDELIEEIVTISNVHNIISFPSVLENEETILKEMFKIMIEFWKFKISKIMDVSSPFLEKIGEEMEILNNDNSKNKINSNYVIKKSKNDNNIFGEIKYDRNKKEMIISYVKESNNNELLEKEDISQEFYLYVYVLFGPYILDKLKKQLIIKSKGKIMNTFFKRNQKSLLVNQLTTLFWKEEIDLEYNHNGAENFIYFIITNIDPNEWYKILKDNKICATEDEVVENLKNEEELKDDNIETELKEV